MSTAHIRLGLPSDQHAFLALWDEFMATDPDEPGDRGMGPVNWDRAMDGVIDLLIAEVDEKMVGFTLYTVIPFTWSKRPLCYLQDICVTSDARGQRIGQSMIDKLAEIGRREGWLRITWMTQSHNNSAQRLYDRVARRTDYIRYDLTLSEA